MTDFRQTDGAVDERITADNQTSYRVEVELRNAGLCRRNQFVVRFKTLPGSPEAGRTRSRTR